MSRQTKLDSFYQSRVSFSQRLKFEDDNCFKVPHVKREMDSPKKRLSTNELSTSPAKTVKIKDEPLDVISLLSDEEDIFKDENKPRDASSDSTISYSPTTSLNSPNTSRSSSSGKKFYSPNKKRNVRTKKSNKVRKNLNEIISHSNVDKNFQEACQKLDDKTIFLLKIVHQYLNDVKLTPLLDEQSKEILDTYMHCDHYGQHLICRLYWRKERWYRLEELKDIIYKNKKMDDAGFYGLLDSLRKCKLLVKTNQKEKPFHLDDYFVMLNAGEVKEICKELKVKFTTKEASKESLMNFGKTQTIHKFLGLNSPNNNDRLLNMLKSKCGDCYKLSDKARRSLDKLHTLMYLGIDRSILTDKKLELLLINDKANKETYPIDSTINIDNASTVFRNRQEFERYFEATVMYDQFLNSSDCFAKREMVIKAHTLYQNISKDNMLSYKSLPVWLRRFTPAHIFIQIMDSGITELKKPPEKEKYSRLCVEILRTLVSQDAFRQHKLAEWYTEMALIYEKTLSEPNKAVEVLLEGLNRDINDNEKDHLRSRARKLASKMADDELAAHAALAPLEKDIKSNHVHKQPVENNSRGRIQFQVRTDDGTSWMTAEEFCRWNYIQAGTYTHCEHWEGKIITTIFSLLFWDIIYKDLFGVRGIFLTRFQRFPLDMFTESFYINRRCLIEDRLSDVEKRPLDDSIGIMKAVWDSRPESELSSIDRSLGWSNIEAICKCLGGRSISVICRRLATDYRYWHSGFPDLTLWNPHTKQIMFVEVKTDLDKPSIKQLQWMKYLHSNNIMTEFCYVGAKTMRNKARNIKSEN